MLHSRTFNLYFLHCHIIGHLYLENKKSQKTLNQNLQAMCHLKQMLRLLDSQNQALGQRNDQYKRERDNLQSEIRNLEGTICNIQHQKEDLQLKFNSLERKHDQHLTELEDERKDKQHLQADRQVFKHRCEELQADRQALQNTVVTQTDTITHFSQTVAHLESMTEQHSTTITAIQQQNQRQQYAILILAALLFAVVCFQFFSQGSNPLSASQHTMQQNQELYLFVNRQ